MRQLCSSVTACNKGADSMVREAHVHFVVDIISIKFRNVLVG